MFSWNFYYLSLEYLICLHKIELFRCNLSLSVGITALILLSITTIFSFSFHGSFLFCWLIQHIWSTSKLTSLDFINNFNFVFTKVILFCLLLKSLIFVYAHFKQCVPTLILARSIFGIKIIHRCVNIPIYLSTYQ